MLLIRRCLDPTRWGAGLQRQQFLATCYDFLDLWRFSRSGDRLAEVRTKIEKGKKKDAQQVIDTKLICNVELQS